MIKRVIHIADVHIHNFVRLEEYTAQFNDLNEKISKEIIVLGTKQDFRPANEVEKQKLLEELETNISSTLTKIKENNGSIITNEISVSINGELITQSNKIKIKNLLGNLWYDLFSKFKRKVKSSRSKNQNKRNFGFT